MAPTRRGSELSAPESSLPAAPSLVLVATSKCDLACEHCFGPRSSETLSLDLLHEVARQQAELTSDLGKKQARVFWQGGEVLTLGREWLADAADVFRDAFAAHEQIELIHHLQTNLASYDSSWNEILREVFGRRVSTSFDYPNLGRRTVDGTTQEEHDSWLQHYRALREAGFYGSVIAVVNAASIDIGPREFLKFYFDDAGVEDLQVNLPFPSPRRPPGSMDEFRRLHRSGALAEFMVGTYEEWGERYRGRRRYLSPFYAFERFFQPQEARRGLPCIWSPDCSRQIVTVGPSSEVGLCDYWVLSRHERCYGNLADADLGELQRGARRLEFSQRSAKLTLEDCRGCPDWPACHGGCPTRAATWLGDEMKRDPYCDIYRAMFSAVRSSRRD